MTTVADRPCDCLAGKSHPACQGGWQRPASGFSPRCGRTRLGRVSRYTCRAPYGIRPEHPGTSPGDPDSVNHLDTLWDLVLYYYEVFDALGLAVGPRHWPFLWRYGSRRAGGDESYTASASSSSSARLACGAMRPRSPTGWSSPRPLTCRSICFMTQVDRWRKRCWACRTTRRCWCKRRVQFHWSMACTGKFVWPVPDKGLKKRIHRIQAPTLIVWGKEDRLVPPVYAQEFASRIPGARIELVEQAGHMPQMEQAAHVSTLVREFLRDERTPSTVS